MLMEVTIKVTLVPWATSLPKIKRRKMRRHTTRGPRASSSWTTPGWSESTRSSTASTDWPKSRARLSTSRALPTCTLTNRWIEKVPVVWKLNPALTQSKTEGRGSWKLSATKTRTSLPWWTLKDLLTLGSRRGRRTSFVLSMCRLERSLAVTIINRGDVSCRKWAPILRSTPTSWTGRGPGRSCPHHSTTTSRWTTVPVSRWWTVLKLTAKKVKSPVQATTHSTAPFLWVQVSRASMPTTTWAKCIPPKGWECISSNRPKTIRLNNKQLSLKSLKSLLKVTFTPQQDLHSRKLTSETETWNSSFTVL